MLNGVSRLFHFSQSEVTFNKTATLAAANIVDPPFVRMLNLAWRCDAAKTNALLAISKLIRSEIQLIVKEGLWGQEIVSAGERTPEGIGRTGVYNDVGISR
jgi:hypothetical protein